MPPSSPSSSPGLDRAAELGVDELNTDRPSGRLAPATTAIASRSTPPSSAASNTTPAPSSRRSCTFAVANEKGEKVVFGSVGGGGRYDGLVSRFMGQPVPATGFSIGVSRLMTALKNLGKLGHVEAVGPVVVARDGWRHGQHGPLPALHLRHCAQAGIRAEMYQGNWKKFGNQLKYADRRNCPLAIIQGGDERALGVVQIKDLIEGKRLAGEIEDNVSLARGAGGAGRRFRRGHDPARARDPRSPGRRPQAGGQGLMAMAAACVQIPRLPLAGPLPAGGEREPGKARRPSFFLPPAGRRSPPAGGMRGEVAVTASKRGHPMPLINLPAFAPDLLAAFESLGIPSASTRRSSSRPSRFSIWPARTCAAASS